MSSATTIVITSRSPLGLVLGVDPASLALVVVDVRDDGAVAQEHRGRVQTGDVLACIADSRSRTPPPPAAAAVTALDSVTELRAAFRQIGMPITLADASAVVRELGAPIDRAAFFVLARERILERARSAILAAPRPLRLAFDSRAAPDDESGGVATYTAAVAAAPILPPPAAHGDTFAALDAMAQRLGPQCAAMFAANQPALRAMFARTDDDSAAAATAERRARRRSLSKARRRSHSQATIAAAAAEAVALSRSENAAPNVNTKAPRRVRRRSAAAQSTPTSKVKAVRRRRRSMPARTREQRGEVHEV